MDDDGKRGGRRGAHVTVEGVRGKSKAIEEGMNEESDNSDGEESGSRFGSVLESFD